MNLKRKLERLASAGPGSQAAVDTRPLAPAAPVPAAPPDAPPDDTPQAPPSADDARAARIADLRGRIHALLARPPREKPPATPPASLEEALPLAREETAHGPVLARGKTLPVTHRHGAVPLHTALDARGDAVATLSLDAALGAFDPARALYLDTETTGLAGGTGTVAFLVGLAWFEGRRLRVEQLFLEELCHEPALLARVAERVEAASALVTFNGKAFDWPLLRSRFVLARMAVPREPPHLDLVHAARRVYRERLEECRLVNLERDVLGFAREGDVPSGEIPARYVHFLRTRDAAPLAEVLEHNLWDLVAMAALLGELAARASGGDAQGRFDATDMAALARTAFRAGAHALAAALADDAAQTGAAQGRPVLAARAHAIAARVHKTRGDHLAVHRKLLAAVALTPDDPALHLALAKLYEHRLRDPARALEHARLTLGAEEPDEHARRVARLRERLERTPLRLPGID